VYERPLFARERPSFVYEQPLFAREGGRATLVCVRTTSSRATRAPRFCANAGALRRGWPGSALLFCPASEVDRGDGREGLAAQAEVSLYAEAGG
jgi:hypothetical protein